MDEEIKKISDGLNQLRKQQKVIAERIKKGEKLLNQKEKERDIAIYNPEIEDSIYCRNDYAGFVAGEYTFYYGYEEKDYHPFLMSARDDSERESWAFVVCKDGKEIYRKAVYPPHVEWNNLAGLLSGIGYWLKESNNA